jgi:shikimate dehydrogenase
MSDIQTEVVRKVGAGFIRTGLLGRGIMASRSPWMHEQEAGAQSLCLTYELFDFTERAWSDDNLERHLKDIQESDFAGVNVTYPFKQEIIPLLDELAPSAQHVGAVNTVRFADGKRIGHNTDVTGFADSLRVGLPNASFGKVVQFGAGGAGSATAQALLDLGVKELILVDPDGAKAAQLNAWLTSTNQAARISCAPIGEAPFEAADGVVNATPIGMVAHPGTPFDPAWLCAAMWVADIVYFPLETRLLSEARARGCQTLDGRRMAVYQAATAFDIFTGMHADRDRMLASFDAFPFPKAA